MGMGTKISWCEATFNPWIGCEKVSEGCRLCYAEVQDKRWGHHRWGKGADRTRTSEALWRKPLAWNAQAKAEGRRIKVFCASFADVFEVGIPDQWRLDLFALIAVTPHLDWLLLTKRPWMMVDQLAPDRGLINQKIHQAGEALFPKLFGDVHVIKQILRFPYLNIWPGVTVESSKHYDRLEALMKVQLPMKWVSVEPQLEPVRLSPWMERPDGLKWIITGGESGNKFGKPQASPYDPEWVRGLKQQCADAPFKVALFVKQMGSRPITLDLPGKGDDPALWPEDLRIQQFPA